MANGASPKRRPLYRVGRASGNSSFLALDDATQITNVGRVALFRTSQAAL
jgi:hypothetical protein